MPAERTPRCLEFERRFDGFLDGELDAHSMRSMALHASQCEECGKILEEGELVQQALSEAVAAEVAEIDTSHLWSKIEASLEPVAAPRPSLVARIRERLALESWLRPLPALAMSGAVAALLMAILHGPSEVAQVTPTQLASQAPTPSLEPNNQAQIERIESSAPHVAVWSEPESHTTAIWVASYEPEGGQ